jgi:RNA polymerase sigma-70 factor (ECF subfamily)
LQGFANAWYHAAAQAGVKRADYLADLGRPTGLLTPANPGKDRCELSMTTKADTPDDSEGPLQLLARAADAMRIRACLDTLDAAHRQSLALAFYHGYSHAEIAQHLNAPLGSVKSWVRRGLERIKQCLGAVA